MHSSGVITQMNQTQHDLTSNKEQNPLTNKVVSSNFGQILNGEKEVCEMTRAEGFEPTTTKHSSLMVIFINGKIDHR